MFIDYRIELFSQVSDEAHGPLVSDGRVIINGDFTSISNRFDTNIRLV